MRQVMKLEIDSIPSNESFARVVVAAFLTRLNPTMEEVADIKTAVSEAVTNAIIHGYQNEVHKIEIEAWVEKDLFTVSVKDFGVGIEDIKKAKEAHYTTRPDLERAGMGLTIIETLSDDFSLKSVPGMGCKLVIKKNYKSLKVQSE